MARPTKFTAEVADRIIQFVRLGASVAVAAEAAGINPETCYRWRQRGEAPYRRFHGALLEAEAVCELRLVGLIARAAVSDPKWAAWLLARKFPQRWGPKSEVAITGSPNRASQGALNLSQLSEEELRTLEALLAKAGQAKEADSPVP